MIQILIKFSINLVRKNKRTLSIKKLDKLRKYNGNYFPESDCKKGKFYYFGQKYSLILSTSTTPFFKYFYKISASIFYYYPVTLKILRALFNPTQDGPFRGCSRIRGGQKGSPFLKSIIDIAQRWNLAQLYLTQRRSKKCIKHVTHPRSSADIKIFSP